MYKLNFKKVKEPEIKLPACLGSQKKELQKNIYFCFIDYTKVFVSITTNCGIFLKRLKYQATLPVSCEICMQDKNHQLELDLEQLTGSVLRKEHIKAVFCHLAHITYMQSSVQFSRSVVSDYLRPHESQHARLPCPSPTPGVHSNSGRSSH